MRTLKNIKRPLFITAPLVFLLCLLISWAVPSCVFFGGNDTSAISEEKLGKGVQYQTTNELVAKGEAEFIKGDYRASYPLFLTGYSEGNLRAVFYMRIILEYGLNGVSPNLEEAQRAKNYLAYKYDDLSHLANTSAVVQRPLYHTAIGYLHYNGLVPRSEKNLRQAIIFANYGVSEKFLPAFNLFARVACEEKASTLFGIWNYTKKDCFKITLRAAEYKDILAMGNLSALYREGIGTDKDPLLAVNWAHKAANLSPPSARAQNDMGYFYETGASVSKDVIEAKKYYTLAQGRYPLAKTNLDRLNRGNGGMPSLQSSVDY
jgi:TPR repeat protein